MSQGRSRDFDQRKPHFDDKRMFAAVCSKCGNKCEVPFRPVDGKPVFCKQCFDKGGNAGGAKAADQFKGQFEMLNAKLDRILKALAPATLAAVPEAGKEEKKKGKSTGKAKAVKKAAVKKKK